MKREELETEENYNGGLMYYKSDVDRLLDEKDKEIATLNDKLRHYPIMVALLESNKKEIAELKAQKAQVEDDCAYWKAKAKGEK